MSATHAGRINDLHIDRWTTITCTRTLGAGQFESNITPAPVMFSE